MLSLKQIKQFYPDSENISERNMLREYLQYKILAAVFESKYAERLSFIGGTASRIIYGSDRFSEDLDLDHSGFSKEEYNHLTKGVQQTLEKEGFYVETRNVFRDTFRCYLKISHLLFQYGLSAQEDEKILIQLDARAEDFDLKPHLKIINKFGVFAQIRVNPPDVLLSQKIKAVLERKRVLGRDLYDIIYLASLTAPNIKYLEEKMGSTVSEAPKEALRERLSSYNLNQLAKDVSPFVSDESRLGVVRKFDQWLEGWVF